jgi:hypothetical protein
VDTTGMADKIAEILQVRTLMHIRELPADWCVAD